MSYPSPTSGLGVAAKIVVEGNQSTSLTPGYNTVFLSLGGTDGPTTFQLNPVIEDASGAVITPGTAYVLTSVAASTIDPLTLTAVAAPVAGVTVYTGTITGGGSNAYEGDTFTFTGFVNAVNNGTFIVTASTATTLSVTNLAAIAETHA